jgi:hypothetical protein
LLLILRVALLQDSVVVLGFATAAAAASRAAARVPRGVVRVPMEAGVVVVEEADERKSHRMEQH